MKLSVLKSIFASMEEGVVFINNQNRIAYCNPAAERILGINLEEAMGESILNYHPFSVREKVIQIIERLKSGQIKGRPRMNVKILQGKFYDNTYSAVWGAHNEYLGVIVVSQDVTQRRLADERLKDALRKLEIANEELKKLDRMKDDFLSNVSHELKTPMISVLGYIGMLLKEKGGPLTGQQKKFLDISYKNLLKLEKNIDNLLGLAELGIQKESYMFEPIDLVQVIQLSCSTVKPMAEEHHIQLEAQLPSEPVTISGVEDKLNQLFDNLLTNAIKYNRRAGRICVSLDQDPQFVFVVITDTGIGISHQSLKEVFTRHFQEKSKPLGNTKGLGIGLSLVQEIVKLHHGEIRIESELGAGSTFTVMLPRKHADCGMRSAE